MPRQVFLVRCSISASVDRANAAKTLPRDIADIAVSTVCSYNSIFDERHVVICILVSTVAITTFYRTDELFSRFFRLRRLAVCNHKFCLSNI